MINLFKTLPLEDFDSEVKRYWVLKKSDMEESEETTIYEVFKATLSSPRDHIKSLLSISHIPFSCDRGVLYNISY